MNVNEIMPQPKADVIDGLTRSTAFYLVPLHVFAQDDSACRRYFGAVLRHTVSPLLGRALLPLNLKAMFAPLPVPAAFARDFPRGFPVRPGQIRAEAQDAATMVPAVAALQQRYRELRLPVVILAGSKDRIVGVDGHAVWFHQANPGS